MNETIYTITNPQKFMTESYLRGKLIKYGFPEEVVSINIIKKEQMAIEIELHFKIPEIANKFFNNYKSKSFGLGKNYKLNIIEGKGTKTDEIPNTNEIIFNDTYESWIDIYYMRKNYEEGLILVNPLQKELQKKMINSLIQNIKSTYIKGHNIINYLFPITTHDKRTLLQVLAYEFKETPFILNKIGFLKEPVEKLRFMTSFFISQIYLSPLRIKPINPLLGETYQVKIGNLNCYFEQTSTDPPTTNIYCYDSDKLYKIYGYISIYTRTGINNCKVFKLGNLYIEYYDGQTYKIYYPSYYIGGITLGKTSFNVRNCSLVIDITNRLISFIDFGDKNKGNMKYPDEFKGKLVSMNEVSIDAKSAKHTIVEEDSISLDEFDGEWTKELRFGGKKYWERNKNNLCKLYEPEYKLKSDSSLREDLQFYNQNDTEKAQTIFNELYTKQSNDFKLRQKYKKG